MPDFSLGPLAGRAMAPLKHLSGREPASSPILWAPQILRADVRVGLQYHFFTTQLYVGTMHLFASSDNDVNVTVGNQELQPTDVQVGAAFDLAPGRSALIYTDDQLNEKFDASKWFAAHPDPAATQLVYVTIWTPNIL